MSKKLEKRVENLETKLIEMNVFLGEILEKVGGVRKNRPVDFEGRGPQGTRTVYRYIRKTNRWGDIEGIGGITFCFVMDYDLRQIRIGWSLCSNENFSKEIGRQFATKRCVEKPIIVEYPKDGIDTSGLLGLIRDKKTGIRVSEMVYEDIEEFLRKRI